MPSDNPPAFPLTTGQFVHERGMTLRDYFAGQSLSTALDAMRREPASNPEQSLKLAAIGAYAIADAMLAARKETPDE